ncbi:MAG: MotA/TolQ/ExbB proton channel family protein [Deltaproteobacteria bacterium]|nr:MotA/TolQ/ExbB proton channel family protein [Deltaproteobacteria bacterium]
MTLWELFLKGGPMMWPLLACSIIAITIFLERLFTLRRDKIIPPTLVYEVERLTRMGRLSDIEQLCKRNSSPICSVIIVAIKNAGMRREIIKDYMEEAGAREAYTIERYIDILGIIATISPLLGLLGTVSGMIKSFNAVGTLGTESQMLASGISEALITTAAGLSIGIPVYICYRFLIARSDYLLLEMEKTSARILEYLKGEQ